MSVTPSKDPANEWEEAVLRLSPERNIRTIAVGYLGGLVTLTRSTFELVQQMVKTQRDALNIKVSYNHWRQACLEISILDTVPLKDRLILVSLVIGLEKNPWNKAVHLLYRSKLLLRQNNTFCSFADFWSSVLCIETANYVLFEETMQEQELRRLQAVICKECGTLLPILLCKIWILDSRSTILNAALSKLWTEIYMDLSSSLVLNPFRAQTINEISKTVEKLDLNSVLSKSNIIPLFRPYADIITIEYILERINPHLNQFSTEMKKMNVKDSCKVPVPRLGFSLLPSRQIAPSFPKCFQIDLKNAPIEIRHVSRGYASDIYLYYAKRPIHCGELIAKEMVKTWTGTKWNLPCNCDFSKNGELCNQGCSSPPFERCLTPTKLLLPETPKAAAATATKNESEIIASYASPTPFLCFKTSPQESKFVPTSVPSAETSLLRMKSSSSHPGPISCYPSSPYSYKGHQKAFSEGGEALSSPKSNDGQATEHLSRFVLSPLSTPTSAEKVKGRVLGGESSPVEAKCTPQKRAPLDRVVSLALRLNLPELILIHQLMSKDGMQSVLQWARSWGACPNSEASFSAHPMPLVTLYEPWKTLFHTKCDFHEFAEAIMLIRTTYLDIEMNPSDHAPSCCSHEHQPYQTFALPEILQHVESHSKDAANSRLAIKFVDGALCAELIATTYIPAGAEIKSHVPSLGCACQNKRPHRVFESLHRPPF